jgi:hypothetical protein
VWSRLNMRYSVQATTLMMRLRSVREIDSSSWCNRGLWVKVGQHLSSRSDVLPPEFIKEFSKLQVGNFIVFRSYSQDSLPPYPFKTVKATIERELKANVDTLFSKIEETPIATASIAQVYISFHLSLSHSGPRRLSS